MKNICKTIGIIILILGVIGSIALAAIFGKDTFGDRSWGVTIGYFVAGIVVTGIQSVIYLALSEIFEYLEYLVKKADDIEQSQKPKAESPSMNQGWECECGRRNPKYTTTCTCGKSKP